MKKTLLVVFALGACGNADDLYPAGLSAKGDEHSKEYLCVLNSSAPMMRCWVKMDSPSDGSPCACGERDGTIRDKYCESTVGDCWGSEFLDSEPKDRCWCVRSSGDGEGEIKLGSRTGA